MGVYQDEEIRDGWINVFRQVREDGLLGISNINKDQEKHELTACSVR